MKKYLTVILLLFGITFSFSEDPTFYVTYFKNYLDYLAVDYPQRRVEALRKVDSVPYIEGQRIYRLVIINDFAYMRTTRSFKDLWKLRYEGKWEKETLYAVADTATYYVKHCPSDFGEGISQELGVIDRIIKNLRRDKSARARVALSKLVPALQKLNQRRIADKSASSFNKYKDVYCLAMQSALSTQLNASSQQMASVYIAQEINQD